ncbi:MAG: PKD domain-containing protein, partial [Dehalococcoidia bacterium]|nr:PKD domain-containing protein [Dehalococcoidia bacterium]
LPLILFNTVLANHPPAIASLEAEPERVLPSESCQIVCTASDRDGDELSYGWSASGGEVNGEGSVVTWTAPDSAGSYDVTVTVTDGRGGEVMGDVTIRVRANEPPTITSLAADADWSTPLGTIQVTCTASDPDGDELSYEWSSSGGSITGTGPEVTWTAPEEAGTYQVTAVVKDGYGAEDTKSVVLSVATGTPPIIEDLIVTADHKYWKETATGYKVGKIQEYYIECIASNTSGELVYEWSYDGGEISGEGSLITWTSPDIESDVTVTVVVTDVADNSVSKSIILNVVRCSACIFR